MISVADSGDFYLGSRILLYKKSYANFFKTALGAFLVRNMPKYLK
jgi:hypothetical protein